MRTMDREINLVKLKRYFLCQLCLIFVLLIVTPKIKTLPTQELEWQINEGDSQVYYYNKRYNIDSENPFQFQEEIRDENGNLVTVVIAKGSTVQYDVTSVTPNAIWGRITYNDSVTSIMNIIARDGRIREPIRKSVDNKSFWEEYCEEDEHLSISEDLIVHEGTYSTPSGYRWISEKWNWKTGWITYYYERSWNSTHILDEIEYSNVPIMNNQLIIPPNMIYGTTFLFIIVILLVGPRFNQIRKNNEMFSPKE